MEQKFTVTAMPHAHVARDASVIELTFFTSEGANLRLAFASDQFDAFANRAIQLFTHVRSQKLTIGDHLAIQPVPVAKAGAEATVGGAKIAMTLMADNGVPYHFVLEPEESRRLRPLLRSAEENARSQRVQKRQ